jgi:GNAT superfamily N-acetyltransferase
VIVLAIDGERVVGASTGLPMEAETEEVKRPFLERGYDPKGMFYFGESVLEHAYRGQGVGVRFFEEREAHARALGRFAWTCFCAVQRPADHPRRPPDYVPLDDFWRRRGYAKHPELSTTFSWREVGEQAQSAKPMVFWLKRIEP